MLNLDIKKKGISTFIKITQLQFIKENYIAPIDFYLNY